MSLSAAILKWGCYISKVLSLAIDRFPRCQKWMHNDVADLKESLTSSWFKRFIVRAQKPEVTRHFLCFGYIALNSSKDKIYKKNAPQSSSCIETFKSFPQT